MVTESLIEFYQFVRGYGRRSIFDPATSREYMCEKVSDAWSGWKAAWSSRLKRECAQPDELTVDIDATYPLVAEEWTYLPASKDEWCRVLKTIAKAWGLKCQQ